MLGQGVELTEPCPVWQPQFGEYMSDVGPEGRSYLPIIEADLRRLADIARRDREVYFEEHPEWGVYADRILCVALCQGAALHLVDGETGINDFNVYTFYAVHPSKRWYAKRIKSYDFGDPRFGQSIDRPGFIGRRVDCLGRAIDVVDGEDAASALRRYVRQRGTEIARCLAKNAVVLLEPECGLVAWYRDHDAEV